MPASLFWSWARCSNGSTRVASSADNARHISETALGDERDDSVRGSAGHRDEDRPERDDHHRQSKA